MAWIAPSLLSANFVSLGEDIDAMENAGAELLHLDVMDGNFVPNLSIGPPVIKAIRKHTKLILDVHLMISNPEALIETFIEAGANYLSIHYETVRTGAGATAKAIRVAVVLVTNCLNILTSPFQAPLRRWIGLSGCCYCCARFIRKRRRQLSLSNFPRGGRGKEG